jgi:hypothetical protein
MKIGYELRNPQKSVDKSQQKKTPINVVIRWKNKRVKVSSEISVFPKHWNKGKSRLTYGESMARDNERLRRFEKVVECIFESFDVKYVPTEEEIRKALRDHKSEINKVQVRDLIQVTDEKINSEEKRLDALNKKKDAGSTFGKYKKLRSTLLEFSKANSASLDLVDINMDWYYDFVVFLREVREYNPNTQGDYVKNLTAIMNLAFNNGYSKNLVHKKREWKKPSQPVIKTYLSETEIDEFYNFDLSNQAKPGKSKRHDGFSVFGWSKILGLA